MPDFAGMTAEFAKSHITKKVCQKMSVINSLHQEHKARLRRIAERALLQSDAPPTSRSTLIAIADVRRRVWTPRDTDYERAWAREIMGLVVDGKQPRRRPRIVDIQRA